MNAKVNKVIYLGDDAAYLRVLAAEVTRIQGPYPVSIVQFFEATSKRIQGLLPKVLDNAPALVIVDFSKQTEDYAHLARLLVRTNTLKPFAVIGLHDYLSPPDQVRESVLSGVTMNFIKSAEVFDPAFAIMSKLDSATKREHGFATAELDNERTVYHLCKSGYVDAQGLHFETNLSLSPTDVLRINSHWTDQKMIPSTSMKIVNTSSSLLFYHFKQSVNAEFEWADPLVTSEGDEPARISELKDDREHTVIKAKKALRGWLEDNVDRSQNKSVRVLVVDRQFNFYRDRERSDKYGYSIRCQPFLLNPVQELDEQRPQVIAYALDVVPEGGKPAEGPVNDINGVVLLAQQCQKLMKENAPFIVVFNMKGLNSKELQEKLNYPHAMAYSGELNPETLLKMAGVFAEKLSLAKEHAKTHADKKAKHETIVFIKKSSPISIIEVEETIKMQRLSETDAVFSCKRPLPVGTVLHMREPIDGYLTITTHPEFSKAPNYYAIINGVGEIAKKELRVLINGFFFKDHDATKLVELEAYQQLNEAKIQERRKQEEAAAAAAALAAAEAATSAADVASAEPEMVIEEKKASNE